MANRWIYQNLKRRFDNSGDRIPLEFKHIGKLRFMLSTVGSWPHREFGRRRLDTFLTIYNLVITYVGTAMMSLCAAYLWFYRHKMTFYDMGHIVLTTSLALLYLSRIILARTSKYRETVKNWLLEFDLYFFKSRSEYGAKVSQTLSILTATSISSQIHIISGIFSFYIQCLTWGGITLFNFQPWYNNYKNNMFNDLRPENRTFEHSAYYYFATEAPYTTNTGYWLLFTYNLYISYNVTCGLCIFDLLLSLIVFQIWGHLKILKHNLLSFPLPNEEMYSAEENMHVRRLLKENIVHHNLITHFVNKCSDTFSEYLLVLYFLLQIISCVLLLEMSSLTTEAFAKYGPLTVGMYQQLIQVSVLFEMLNTKSEQVIDAVYEVPWECMDTCNRRTVLLLLHRVQTPLSLKAGKVVPVGVRTMFAVLKTTFSYYMMLITVAREK